jgi:predicted nucleic acid-binding protein
VEQRPLITFDTSGVYALVNRRDPDHARVRRVLDEDTGPYLMPAGILGELAFLIESRLGTQVLDAVLQDLESGDFVYECGEKDFRRIRALVGRYADLPLGYADAAVIACAERNQGKVLTLDERDFGVVAAEGTIQLLPSS